MKGIQEYCDHKFEKIEVRGNIRLFKVIPFAEWVDEKIVCLRCGMILIDIDRMKDERDGIKG